MEWALDARRLIVRARRGIIVAPLAGNFVPGSALTREGGLSEGVPNARVPVLASRVT